MQLLSLTLGLGLILAGSAAPSLALLPFDGAASPWLIAAATQPAPKTAAPGLTRVITYQTESGVRFTAAFSSPAGSVILSTPDWRRRLQPVPTASGAKYSDGEIIFWSKGEEASVEAEGKILYHGWKIKEE
jgi:membrane-bound inhibitor of C-type lysozyme